MKKILRLSAVVAVLMGLLSGYVRDAPRFGRASPYSLTGDPGRPLEPICEELGIAWPPKRLRLLALKEEKVLEAWAAGEDGVLRRLITYSITAASGGLGPKRKEGDMQVPEGIYRLTDLNPWSRYHLSIRIAYPGPDDIAHSRLERSQMGGDIMLHGNAVSIGCIAIGDEAIERVYALIESVPRTKRDILIAPVDFRVRPGFRVKGEEPWVDELYENIEKEMAELPLSGNTTPVN